MRVSNITLVIPGLLPIPAAIGETDLPDCRSLHNLLVRSNRSTLSEDAESWLFSRFGYTGPARPYAALGYLADSGESRRHVMRADPVHLSAGREGAMLFDNTMLKLGPEEAESLAEIVRPYLDEFAAGLKVMQPDRWYLLCEQPPRIQTHPLMQVVGCDVSDRLPTGADQVRWRQLFNEIQMLLHEAPVNKVREQHGQLPVNSLWFWGEGELRPSRTHAFDLCVSDDALATGLAQQQQIPVRPIPAGAGQLFSDAQDYRNMIIVDKRVHHLSAYQDIVGWRNYVAAFEQDWARPLQQALIKGTLETLTMVTGDYVLSCRRRHLLRFWRRQTLIDFSAP